jgi:putative hydrolase of HD superfamily
MSLLTIRKFSHLPCVQDFLENILTDMLKERFIPKTELMDITESIMNKEI